MTKQRANALGDYARFFTHFGLITAVSAGAFITLGFPPVMSAFAVGATLGIKLGLMPLMKDSLQIAINSEKRNKGRDPLITSMRNRMKNSLKRAGLGRDINKFLPEETSESPMQIRVEGWVKDFSKTLGLRKTPLTLVMPESRDLTDNLRDGSIKSRLGKELLREFNKYANAFAFSHNKDNVVLTDRLVNTLSPQEVKGVVAHEVGHLAARHGALRETMGMVSLPARFLVTFNSLLTIVSSFKNAGIYILAGAIGRSAANVSAQFLELDQDEKLEKAKIDTIQKYATQASLAGLSITLGAPEILAAQVLSLATHEALTLLERSNSRHNEFQADRIAARLTGKPEAMCSALQKIRSENLKVEKGFDYSEPAERKHALSPLFSRIRDLKKTHPGVERRCEALMNVRIQDIPTSASVPVSGPHLNQMMVGCVP